MKGIIVSIHPDNTDLIEGAVTLTELFPGIPDYDKLSEDWGTYAMSCAANRVAEDHDELTPKWDSDGTYVVDQDGENVSFTELLERYPDEMEKWEGSVLDDVWRAYKWAIKEAIEAVVGDAFTVTVESITVNKGFTPDVVRLVPTKSWKLSVEELINDPDYYVNVDDTREYLRETGCKSYKQAVLIAMDETISKTRVTRAWDKKWEHAVQYRL